MKTMYDIEGITISKSILKKAKVYAISRLVKEIISKKYSLKHKSIKDIITKYELYTYYYKYVLNATNNINNKNKVIEKR